MPSSVVFLQSYLFLFVWWI